MARKFLSGIDLSNQRLQNVASGTDPTDGVNLAQLQSAVAGLSWHGAVRAASTGNVSLTSPGATLDGVTLSAGNRVLIKNQTTASQNGVYIWNGATSALSRAADGQQGTLTGGAAFYINEGTVNGDSAWTLVTDDPITIDTTALTFNRFGAGTAYTAGTGLTLSGTQFSINTTVVARKYAASIGDGSSTSYTITHSLATLDVTVQIVLISTGETVEADVTRPTTNTVTVAFATAPATNTYRVLVVG